MAAESSEDVYLAEKVVDSGFGQQDGKRYYKVKWVRFTWELEEAINIKLKDLLDAFWAEHGGDPNAKLTKSSSQQLDTPANDKPNKEQENDNIQLSSTNINNSDVPPSITETHTTGVELEISPTPTNDEVTTTYDENGKEIKYITLEKHECDVCYRTYSSAQSLKMHRKSHQTERSFQCETCLKCFAERSTLKRHMFIHLEEKPFKCDHCERAFSDKSTLRRHMITHTGTKRFQCTRCDKRFTRNEHLRQHMYIHTAEKLYRCEICNKDFRQRSTRKNHMLLHRAENGLKCETCGAAFSRQNLYDKHVLWCTGNPDEGFKCHECDKKFQDRAGLKRHQMIHSGDRPFKCEHCDQSFNDRSVLRRHAFTHEERKPFQCEICHKDFIRKAALNLHMASQHPTIRQQSSMFNLVQPVTYNINEGISLDPQSLDPHVQFVIHNSDTDVVENAINQVEVSSNNVRNDGVSMLAHAVCSIPQEVLTVAAANSSQVLAVEKPHTAVPTQNVPPGSGSQGPLQIQLAQDAIQPGDNQLLQVQIIRMADGNQFVQSIQAIVQGDEKDYREPDLVVNESHVIGITEEVQNPIITGGDSMMSQQQSVAKGNLPGGESFTTDTGGGLEKSYTHSSTFSTEGITNTTTTSLNESERFSSNTLGTATNTYPSFTNPEQSSNDVTNNSTTYEGTVEDSSHHPISTFIDSEQKNTDMDE